MADQKPVKTPVDPPAEYAYEVLADGWIAGAHRKRGAQVTLTEATAKYELLSGKLALAKSGKTVRPARTGRTPSAPGAPEPSAKG